MKPKRLNGRPAGLLAVAALALTCTTARAATKYQVLHNFPYPDDGVVGSVTVDADGNVFGGTANGGTGKECGEYRCGYVFELTPQPGGKWTLAVIHDFGGRDGAGMNGPLILDASGNLYGTTQSGGKRGGGALFELTPGGGWSMAVLYSFCNQQGCVGLPGSGVVMDPSGNLYGTTPQSPTGGAAYQVGRVSGQWKETTLHRFCPKGPTCPDGDSPDAGVILDASGNLYGTASYGGTGCGGEGCGTVYELTPESNGKWKETILHRFDNNGKDGVEPGAGPLLADSLGNLYGTTEAGGANTGCAGAVGGVRWPQLGRLTAGGDCGTVFKLAKNADGRWKETILHNFALGAGGYAPYAGVVMNTVGNLYGTTGDGGNQYGCGVLYKLAPTGNGKWKYSVLHTFGNGYDGCLPVGNLAIDSKGNLYGGTIFGGKYGNGIVFELTP